MWLSNSKGLVLTCSSSYTSVLLVGIFNAIFKGTVFFKGDVQIQGCSACERVQLVLHLKTLDALEALKVHEARKQGGYEQAP